MKKENCSGFTLLEILIAWFIFAAILSTIYASYTGTLRVFNETEYRAEISGMARIALQRIYEDLEAVYLAQQQEETGADEELEGGEKQQEAKQEAQQEDEEETVPLFQFVGERIEVEGGRADSLRFGSRAHLVLGEGDSPGGVAQIGYYVEEKEGEEDQEEEGLVLFRSDRVAFNFGNGTELPDEEPAGDDQQADGLIICDKLESFRVTYYDEEGEEHDEWDSTSDEFQGTLPRRVSILLEFMNKFDPEAPYKFMTSVALPGAQGEAEGEGGIEG